MGWDVIDPVEIRHSTACFHFAKCGHSTSNGTSVFRAIRRKTLVFHISRSLKVIGTDPDRCATYDFLLLSRSNHGPISYRFREKRRNCKKIPVVYLTPPLSQFPLEFCHGGGARKTRMMPDQTKRHKTYIVEWPS